jgi:acyl-CoA oxidase
VLESFDDAARAAEGDGVAAVLGRLCDLHALAELERDRAFFLEQGYFEPVKAKAVRKLVLELCAELRPQAVHLVDAFAIPEFLLAAPIAR